MDHSILRSKVRVINTGYETDCWVWQGPTTRDGYGKYGNAYAHRAAYELFHGDIDPELQLDHLCRHTTCVNHQHLEPVSADENMRRQGQAVTHCTNGHLYTPDTTYIAPKTGHRQCRTCRNQRDNARRRK